MSEAQAECDRLLSAKEAARRMGLSPWTIYHWAQAGRLPSVKLGRRRLFRPPDLQEFVASHHQPAAPETGRR